MTNQESEMVDAVARSIAIMDGGRMTQQRYKPHAQAAIEAARPFLEAAAYARGVEDSAKVAEKWAEDADEIGDDREANSFRILADAIRRLIPNQEDEK